MRLNSFSIRVPEGTERTTGYVEIGHGKQYTIVLGNKRSVRCDAEVNVDGKRLGTFRINAHETIRLERPLSDDGRFTFYVHGSEEARKSELHKISKDDLGLISVTFKPEKICPIRPIISPPWIYRGPHPYVTWDDDYETYWTSTTDDCSANISSTITAYNFSDLNPGGTGLSGHSDQSFYQVNELDYDFDQITTIHVRLVEGKKSSPRPLRPSMRSTPIPEPVNGC